MARYLVPEDIDNLYRIFSRDLATFIWLQAIPDAYPDWLTVSRGHIIGVSYGLARQIRTGSRLPHTASKAIGATIGTSAIFA